MGLKRRSNTKHPPAINNKEVELRRKMASYAVFANDIFANRLKYEYIFFRSCNNNQRLLEEVDVADFLLGINQFPLFEGRHAG
eukprot:gene4508-6731_t